MMTKKFDYVGFGLGLRTDHYEYVLEHKPALDWFEVVTENFFVNGGRPLHYLEQFRALYPIIFHGVSLSIGSSDPINFKYLDKVKALVKRFEPPWISDHLCWTGVNQHNSHDLLPVAYDEVTLNHVVDRINQVQDYLGQTILLENPSSYVSFKHSTYSECDFIKEMSMRSGCLLLLDINNIYVSHYNHGFDPVDYINSIPVDKVQQFHLAGHTNYGDYIIDTHDADVIDEVWKLYEVAVSRFGQVTTMIERDDHIPDFPILYDEIQNAKSIATKILNAKESVPL